MRAARFLPVAVVLALASAGCTAAADPGPSRPSPVASAEPEPSTFAGSGFGPCPLPQGEPVESVLGAAALTCMDGSGSQVLLSRPTGRPLVVNLWGSWCPPCGKELPAFQRLHADAGGRVVVLGVVTADGAERSVGAGRALGITFPNVYDRAEVVRRAIGVRALPATVFVGADGRVRYVHSGPPLTDDTLRTLVDVHLGVRVR